MKHRYILVVPKNEKCQSNFKSIEKNINNKLTHKYNIQCTKIFLFAVLDPRATCSKSRALAQG